MRSSRPSDWGPPHLLGVVNTNGASKFDKILSAHNTLSDAINDARNAEGAVAHGKDGFLDRMSAYHARTYVLAADTVVGLLMEAFDGIEPSLRHTRDPHERFEHLNARINERVAIEATSDDEDGSIILTVRAGGGLDPFDLMFPPSRLLYDLDREVYVQVLDALRDVQEAPPPEEEESAVDLPDRGGEARAAHEPRRARPTDGITSRSDLGRLLEPQARYEGKYASYKQALFDLLLHTHRIDRHLATDDLQTLTYTLLHAFENLVSVDWHEHSATSARMMVTFKRILRKNNVPSELGTTLAPAIVEWFAANLVEE